MSLNSRETSGITKRMDNGGGGGDRAKRKVVKINCFEMVAMSTKLACLHALFLFYICPFVVCTFPSIPDGTVTGTLKPLFCLIKLH